MWAQRTDQEKQQHVERLKKSRTKETYKKVSKALTGRKLSQEHATKARRAGVGHKHTEEFKQQRRAYKHTTDAIEKIRKYQKGRKKSIEQIVKQSGPNHWTKKRSGHSEITKHKISESNNCKKIPIRLTNLITGEVKEFLGIKVAAKALNLHSSGIRNALLGKQTNTKGWICEY